jgi:hypothetical protein
MKLDLGFNPMELVGIVSALAGGLWSLVKWDRLAGMPAVEVGLVLIVVGGLCNPFFTKK